MGQERTPVRETEGSFVREVERSQGRQDLEDYLGVNLQSFTTSRRQENITAGLSTRCLGSNPALPLLNELPWHSDSPRWG